MENMDTCMKNMNADEVRRSLPKCVEFADMIRDQFGDGVRMIWAKENGHELGKQSSNGARAQRVSDIDLTPIMTADQLRKRGRDGK